MKTDLWERQAGRRNHPEFLDVDGLAALVANDSTIAMGGFHFSRLPIALVQAIARLGVTGLEYISWGGSLGLEILIDAGCIAKLGICFNSLDLFGLAPRFRAAVESGAIPVEDYTDTVLMEGHRAARHGMPSGTFVPPAGSTLLDRVSRAQVFPDPLTAEEIGIVEAIPLDTLLLHAQRADERGNIEIQGARNLDLTAGFAARDILVTVEEIVPSGTFQRRGEPRGFILPRSFVRAIAKVPYGAYPTSCLPYYPTDYRELARVTSSDSLAIELPTAERKQFLSAAANIDPETVTGKALLEFRSDPEPPDAPATIDEIMVWWLAQQYNNDSICSVGSFSPLAFVSYLVAKQTHAPNLVILSYNGGLIDIGDRPMALTLAEPLDFQTAVMHCGGDDSFHWYYQRGLITHEVVSAAQIDRHCRTNNFEVRSPSGRLIRLPGQGGMADVANMHQHFMLYLPRHTTLTMVDHVDVVSAARGRFTPEERRQWGLQPGVVRLITNLGVFHLDPDTRELALASIHPGVTLDEIQENTGFPIRALPTLEATATPDTATLARIRYDIDPLGMRRVEFVAGKERGPLLASLIDAEESAIRALTVGDA